MNQGIYTISSTRPVEIVSGFSSTSPTGGWNSLSAKRTTSFAGIHQEVAQTVTYSPGYTYKAYNPNEATSLLDTEQSCGPRRSRGENPGGNAVGDNSVPVGDMLLPILAMAIAYIMVKLFRKRKTYQVL